MFHTWHAGADCISPAPYIAIRANGDKAWFGWPDIPLVETEIANWFDAKNLDEEKAAIRRLNKAALDNVVYAPTGFFLGYQAWRKNVRGVVKGPLPFFWGVCKDHMSVGEFRYACLCHCDALHQRSRCMRDRWRSSSSACFIFSPVTPPL